MSRMVSIYTLSDGPNDPPRYVGKTSHWLRRRYQSHLSAARRGKQLPVCRWIRKLLSEGRAPNLKWIESVKSQDDWEERESYWISKFRADGFDLLNLTDGGEGAHGHVRSPLHKAKIALSLRSGATKNCQRCGNRFWRKRSEIAAGEDKFCSRLCYAASLKGKSRPVSEACKQAGIKAAAEKRRAMTHCKRDHPLSGDNVYMNPRGVRICKSCRKIHKRNHRNG